VLERLHLVVGDKTRSDEHHDLVRRCSVGRLIAAARIGFVSTSEALKCSEMMITS
jgi:hypothetical protein